MNITTPACSPTRPCRKHAECYRCGKGRQVKIANTADTMFRADQKITFSVITPTNNTAGELKRIKHNYLKRSQIELGIFTIERGAIVGKLHVNIIHTGYAPPTHPGSMVWQEKARATPRQLAAYIAKPESIPTQTQYPGHTWGTIGQITRLLASADAPLHINMAAAEQLIRNAEGLAAPCQIEPTTTREKTLTKEEFRKIAERHLPLLRAMLHRRHNA